MKQKAYQAYAISRDGVVRYIGITTVGIDKRWAGHKRQKKCTALVNALKTYGAEAFTIEHIASSWDAESLCDVESILVKQWDTLAPTGYNLTTGGKQNLKFSEATRARIAQSKIGKPRPASVVAAMLKANVGRVHGAEMRAKVSAATKGRKHTAEAKAKISVGHKGKIRTPEHAAAIANANRGRKHTSEARAKMSTAHTGRKWSQESIEKLIKARTGAKASEQARANMSKGQTGRKHPPEILEKMRIAATGRKHTPETREKMRQIGLARSAKNAGEQPVACSPTTLELWAA